MIDGPSSAPSSPPETPTPRNRRPRSPSASIVDGGNSFYKDTQRRYEALGERGLRFLGVGGSGGEEGALLGPSIMPGGDEAAYRDVEEIFTKIAAQVDGTP